MKKRLKVKPYDTIRRKSIDDIDMKFPLSTSFYSLINIQLTSEAKHDLGVDESVDGGE